MKNCPNCNAQIPDNATFCPACGANFAGQQPQQPQQPPQQFAAKPWDHTTEFHPKDVSDNKVIAMLLYLVGLLGIFIALLGGIKSDYLSFHVRQCLKIMVLECLLIIIATVLAITFIVPIAAFICLGILEVVKIICFFQICGNKSIEPPIVRSFGFLK